MSLPDYMVVQQAAPSRIITQQAFRARVTDDLVAEMELEAMHNPADPLAVQKAKAVARARMARTFSAEHIDLDNPELNEGFASYPAPVRARIFDAPVQPNERPAGVVL